MTHESVAFITGAEGFIGSHLTRFLSHQGWKVIGGFYHPVAQDRAAPADVEMVHCDLSNGQRVAQLLRQYRPTHIFHLGAQSYPTISWQDPIGTFQANIMGSLNLLEAARYLDIPPVIVCACSSAEYGIVPAEAIPVTEDQPLRPLHPYGISKLCLDLLGQQYSADYGIPTVMLRLFNTTGPGKTGDAPSDFVRQIVRIKLGLQPARIEVGNLQTRRAFLDVQDTVRGFFLAALRGVRGSVYNLCASRLYTVATVLETAMEIAGVDAHIEQVDRLMRPSDEQVIFGSSDKLIRETGWEPQRSLHQTLSSMVEYWEHAFHLESSASLTTI
jgi:GDP-4-dehydro-6-deoxy-D-mannose reductase